MWTLENIACGTLPSVPPLYRTEAALVSDLLDQLSRTGAALRTEFDYTRGRSDVVALTEGGELFAIEAKLTRWRDALHQAYRNRCFAHRSYVALPPTTAALAGQYTCEFVDRGVGILSVSPGRIDLILDCEAAPPLQQWLTDVALRLLKAS